jgi:hypothetical protein
MRRGQRTYFRGNCTSLKTPLRCVGLGTARSAPCRLPDSLRRSADCRLLVICLPRFASFLHLRTCHPHLADWACPQIARQSIGGVADHWKWLCTLSPLPEWLVVAAHSTRSRRKSQNRCLSRQRDRIVCHDMTCRSHKFLCVHRTCGGP